MESTLMHKYTVRIISRDHLDNMDGAFEAKNDTEALAEANRTVRAWRQARVSGGVLPYLSWSLRRHCKGGFIAGGIKGR
jgi:hypothetical protein